MQPILLADDDANSAFLATRAMKEAGIAHPVVTLRDGDAVVEYLAGSAPRPLLLLLDQKLPGRSGLEVLEWVRTKSSMVTLPVLLLSASTFDGDVRAAYLLGANGYLVKPATFEALLVMAKAIKDYWLTVNRAAEPSPR
jgi:DNA-binding response OmpR family regulator